MINFYQQPVSTVSNPAKKIILTTGQLKKVSPIVKITQKKIENVLFFLNKTGPTGTRYLFEYHQNNEAPLRHVLQIMNQLKK